MLSFSLPVERALSVKDLGSFIAPAGVLLVLITLFVFLGLRELLKPVDKRRSPSGRKWKLPPGPRGLPIIGNLLMFSNGEAAARELVKYGELATTHLGSKLWVILNSDRLVNELYAKRGSVTNGRPPNAMVTDLVSQGRRSVLLNVDGWTERRRVMHQLLSGTALTRYQQYQDFESKTLLRGYLEDPKQWYEHNHRYSNSVIHRITFGESPGANENMKDVQHAQFLFLLNAPPFNLWDCFPGLTKLPKMLQFWRGKYDKIGEFTNKAYSGYWNPIKAKIESGAGPHSFARDLIRGEGKYKGNDLDRMFLAMQLVEAGSDTTRLGINIAILAAVVHPEAFLKARAEVDGLCGANVERLPAFEDEASLPYINAFAKELFRWRRVFDWTPEHALTDDLEFEGYFFPKGTCFVINQVGIARNPEIYNEPEKFVPDRWLDKSEADFLNKNWQFGAGRRVCVGARLAQKSLFINIARLVYCFDFKAREAFDDSDIKHFSTDEPFPVDVKIRGEAFENLIRNISKDLE